MTIKFKLVLIAIAVFAFSCKQPSAKVNNRPGAGSKMNVNLGTVSPLLSITDSLTSKQSKKTTETFSCCKGVPSRFGYKAKATKGK